MKPSRDTVHAANKRNSLLSLEMLRHIAGQRLPLTIEAPADIEKVRVLRAAGLVAAFFLNSSAGDDSQAMQTARVLAITPAGRDAIAGLASP